jgi:6-phosphogluconate dehydrogenase
VHNGIEYAIMELLAESYDLLRRGLGLSSGEVAGIFAEWQQGELASYLVEITPPILRRVEEKTGQPLIDLILDQARQKGTGKWTSQEAMDLQVPTPTIDTAVMMRDLSGFKAEREAASQALQGPSPAFQGDRPAFIRQLGRALYTGMVLAFAQGLALLRQGSQAHGYQLPLEAVARIWRGGCIIRAALLEDIRAAYQTNPELPHLLLGPHLGREVVARIPDLRAVAATAADLGRPAAGLLVSLAYYDAYRSARLPANLIQAQRDYFGAHTYQRTDLPGTFHTHWEG